MVSREKGRLSKQTNKWLFRKGVVCVCVGFGFLGFFLNRSLSCWNLNCILEGRAGSHMRNEISTSICVLVTCLSCVNRFYERWKMGLTTRALKCHWGLDSGVVFASAAASPNVSSKSLSSHMSSCGIYFFFGPCPMFSNDALSESLLSILH